MFDFLFHAKKQKIETISYPLFEAVEIDIHSHVLPNIDDGSPDMQTSVQLIREMIDLGFRSIIATPHISELYPNENTTIENTLIQLKKQLKREQLDIDINIAAEYMINDVFEQKILSGERLLTLPNNHILVELSHISEPVNLYKVIAMLVERGYTPILAHPERYRYYNNNLAQFQRLINCGCHLQVNALSLDGYYGRMVSDCAWALLNNYMIEFIGTDIHHAKHIDMFKHNISPKSQHIFNNYPFQNKKLTRFDVGFEMSDFDNMPTSDISNPTLNTPSVF
jgi:tyrosine-protein phosphatase YwqE